ncbi:CAP domain-containing protein [Desulfurispora thermophila]|uniref:CAP domain-containing protein n=1 Tax=Desulfurispora thermophila TaxID=265470 RepID=UPI001FA6DF5D|nr:CAP domain-containing protein [Desulfurispora thermophila]
MSRKYRAIWVTLLAMLLLLGLSGAALAGDDAARVAAQVNQLRQQAGVPAVQLDSTLCQLAQLKAQDMVQNNYFGQTSPTYGSFSSMLKKFNISYTSAAQCLVRSTSLDRAQQALQNSSSNRKVLLDKKYGRLGVGVAKKGSYTYLVEVFVQSCQPGSGSGSQPGNSGGSQSGSAPGGSTTPTVPAPGTGSSTPVAGLTADEQKMVDLVNAERAAQGLAPLKVNLELTRVARLKAKDMIDNNYFSHTSPTYGSPFDMMKQFGITYRTAGENLAGAPDVNTAHTNLMNSPGHRANILNANFKEVGIGVLEGSIYGKIFVQMFIG